MDVVVFYVAAAITLIGAVLVLVLPNVLRGAMALIMSLSGLSVVYLLLHAPFVAVMQLLVYAGAILVLFVFVIMLLNLEMPPHTRGMAWVAGVTLLVLSGSMLASHYLMGGTLGQAAAQKPAVMQTVRTLSADFGTVEQVGMSILKDYTLPFEMLSVLLLVSVVGAVVISKKRL